MSGLIKSALPKLYTIGSLTLNKEAGIKCLVATPAAANEYMSFETPVGDDYQVPAGKVFYITKIIHSPPAANHGFNLGYGDTGVASGVAAPTNSKQMLNNLYGIVAGEKVETDVFIPIPAEKYPYVRALGGAGYLTIFGVEI